MLLSERIQIDGLHIKTEHVCNFKEPTVGVERARWKIFLHYGDETPLAPLTLEDWECEAGVEPTVQDVMYNLTGDCARIALADNYEEWASEFDTDPAKWPSRDTYDAWSQLAWELNVILGDELYHDYLFNTDRTA